MEFLIKAVPDSTTNLIVDLGEGDKVRIQDTDHTASSACSFVMSRSMFGRKADALQRKQCLVWCWRLVTSTCVLLMHAVDETAAMYLQEEGHCSVSAGCSSMQNDPRPCPSR